MTTQWNRMTRVATVAIAAGGVLAACAADAEDLEADGAGGTLAEVIQESQCGGTWDVQDVESYTGAFATPPYFVVKHERRVGYHVGPGCSGTLISDDLFISAGHCGYAVNDVVRFDYQNLPSGSPRATRDFRVSQVVEQEYNASYDYAIVRLEGSPGREYGHANVTAVDPPAGSNVTVIQHPARLPKKIHAGAVLDYASPVGANWFRHQVDTTGGSSGSGVLDGHGNLVGIHTNAGCMTTAPIAGNSAMRMSRLVPHSPTLQALVRSRILWTHTTGKISLWSVNADGTQRNWIEHGPFAGYAPVSLAQNRILWRHTDGRASLWRIDDNGNYVSHVDHGPFAGWTPVSFSNNRLVWQHTSGKISFWTVNDAGALLSYVESGPFTGWSFAGHANNRTLWRHTTGKAAIGAVDEAGNLVTWVEHGPFPGWTALEYNNGEVLWRHTDGRTSHWQVDRTGFLHAYLENGPHGGWLPLTSIDRRMMWLHSSGTLSYWNVNGDAALLGYVEHGPFAGWTPRFTTGGQP